MSLILKGGDTSQSIYVEVLDSASTTGGRKTGLAFNTSGLTAYYARQGGAAVAITLATLAAASSAYSSGGFKEVDAANMPGIYRLDIPDAAIAAGVRSVVVTLKGATGMVQVSKEIMLVAIDPQDVVRAGLTALPNAAAEAAGGLYTRGAGAGQINQDAAGQVDVNLVKVSGTAQTAGDIIADTNDLQARLPAALVSGRIDASVGAYQSGQAPLQPTVAGHTLDVSAGGEAGLDWANVGSPTTTVGLTGTTISTSQAVASVSGAVGSVTGNVGGNVTGSVGSVAGNVGGSVASVATGGIAAASFAANAIDASALAASAVAEIQSGLGTSANQTTINNNVLAVGSAVAALNDISAGQVENAVWDATLASHQAAGSTGEALSNAGAGGDPWATALPGAYGPGTAGAIVGTNLDAAVSSRLGAGSYAAPDNAGIAAIKAKTDNLPGAPAAVGDIPTAAANADKLLGRSLAGGADGGRTVQDALRMLRNRRAIAGGTLTVYQENDSSAAWTAAVATAAGDPVDSIDPA